MQRPEAERKPARRPAPDEAAAGPESCARERTGENRITDQTLPGVFREMASVQVQEFDTLCGESVPILLREEERVWEATDNRASSLC